MDRNEKINRGLSRSMNAEQARQSAMQRIEATRQQSLKQTIKHDPRLAIYGTDLSPAEVVQYCQEQSQSIDKQQQ